MTLPLLFRLAFKHNHTFSKRMIKKIIFNLVPMVEELIAGEMSQAGVGAIMHDGWLHTQKPRTDTHYTLYMHGIDSRMHTVYTHTLLVCIPYTNL